MIKQQTSMDCGVCALAMLLGTTYENAHHQLAQLPSMCGDPAHVGVMPGHLLEAGLRFGEPIIMMPYRVFMNDDLPETHGGVYQISVTGRKSHFVFVSNGIVYDPADGNQHVWRHYRKKHNAGVECLITRGIR